jgi:hypothetical protein
VLEEALIRARGELTAVGLRVEIHSTAEEPPLDPSTDGASIYGSLVFAITGSVIEIRAFAPGVSTPIVEAADTADADVDAEVVAVRAVEALRAAMLQYARRARAAHEALPSTVRGFTRLEDQVVEARKPRDEKPESTPETAAQNWVVNAWLGSLLTVAPAASVTTVGGRVAVYAGRESYFAGLSADMSWGVEDVTDTGGSARIRRQALTAHARAELPVTGSAVMFLQLGAGVLRYRFPAFASQGFVAHDAEHLSPRVGLEIGSAYWVASSFGAYFNLGGFLATDAATLRFAGREVAELDRPALSASIGIIVGRKSAAP